MQGDDEMRELIERSALAIGFSKLEDGTWLNSWGATCPYSPADVAPEDWAPVLRRAFEPSFETRMSGRYQAFANAYRYSMTPKELCELVIGLKEKK